MTLPSTETYPVVDARGHKCPVPTLKLRKVLQDISGAILLADDPMAQIDVPHFCTQNSYLLESVEIVGNHWVFRVRNMTIDRV